MSISLLLLVSCDVDSASEHTRSKGNSTARTAPDLSLTAIYSLPDAGDSDSFGLEVDGGDINGDGYADVLTTADYRYTWGAAYIYSGSSSGLGSTYQEVISPNPKYGEAFAFSSAVADLDGDGRSEAILSGPGYSEEAYLGGVVYIFAGTVTGAGSVMQLESLEPVERGYFGYDVANAGDTNADGYDDLIVMEPYNVDDIGSMYLYLGSISGVSTTADAVFLGEWEEDGSTSFGISSDGLGDTDGDGFGDVLAGAPGTELKGYGDIGAAYFYLGSTTGLQPAQTIEIPDVLSRGFGEQVAKTGDVNGDGYNDALITAPNSRVLAGYGGEVFIYYGSVSGIRSTDYESVYNPDIASSTGFGFAASGIGDLDGDGFADFAAMIGKSDPETNGNRLFLYFGAASGVSEAYLPLSATEDGGPHIGFPGYVGDTNADGYDDLFFGASDFDYRGSAYYYLGVPEDADNDGVGKPDDCDDSDPKVGRGTLSYPDDDGDGYGDPEAGDYLCAPVSGWGEESGDCDDEDASVSPSGVEVCGDGIDNDCDGFGTDADDEDSDGLSGTQERVLGTDLCDNDSDDDGLSDGDEVNVYQTDPLDIDTDGDGASDGDEIAAGTDPLHDDTPQDTAEIDTGEPVEDTSGKETPSGCRRNGQAGVLGGLLWLMVGRRRRR